VEISYIHHETGKGLVPIIGLKPMSLGIGLGHHLHQKEWGARHFGEDVGEGHLQLLVMG